jgi:hypothetical protein
MSTIIEKIKTELNNDTLFEILLPKIKHQIDFPDPEYGVISPMYSLMPLFVDYYKSDELSQEQLNECDRVIRLIDNAFGFGWAELSSAINQKQLLRAKNLLKQLNN